MFYPPIGSFLLLFAVTHCYFVKLRLANDHSHGAVFCHLAFFTRRDYLDLVCRFVGTELEKCLENSRDVSYIFIYFLVTILKSSFHISPVSYFLVMGIQTNGFSCSRTSTPWTAPSAAALSWSAPKRIGHDLPTKFNSQATTTSTTASSIAVKYCQIM